MVRKLYGKLDARIPVGLRHFFSYVHNPLPEGPAAVAAPAGPGVADDPDPSFPWGLLGNDRLGDCTFAAIPHLREANAERAAESETWPGADATSGAYLTFTGGIDSGCDEAQVLAQWCTAGILGNRCVGYGWLRAHYLGEIRSCIAAFGGVYLGADMPVPAQDQFDNDQPWALTGTDDDQNIEGGHAFPAVGYDSEYLYVVTWGRVQRVTWQWWEVYGTEAWVVLTSEDAAASNGVNLARLQADLAIVHSRIPQPAVPSGGAGTAGVESWAPDARPAGDDTTDQAPDSAPG